MVIWNSVPAMTFIDLLIMGMVGYSFFQIFKIRKRLPSGAAGNGNLVLIGGLGLIAAFYLVDLFLMHVLPSFAPMAETVAAREALHLNHRWFVALFGVGFIAFGFTRSNLAVVGLVKDVKAAEEQAEAETSAVLETALQVMAQGFVVYGPDQTVVACNDKFIEMARLPAGCQPVGMTHEEILIHRAREGKTAERLSPDVIQKRLKNRLSGKPTVVERERADGTAFIYHGRPLPGGGYVGTYTDVTERNRAETKLRESEARYRDLFEGAHLGIKISSVSRNHLYANQSFLDLFGFASMDEALEFRGKIIAPHDRERILKNADSLSRGEKASTVYEFDGIRKDGTIIPLQVYSRKILWEGEESYQRTYIDLTERKQAEQKVYELNQELEKRVEQRTKDLKASESRAYLQFNNSPIPIFCWRKTGDDFIAIDRNIAADELYTGIPRTKFLNGMLASEVLAQWPEGRQCMARCCGEQRTISHVGERPTVIPGEKRWKDTTFVFLPPDMVMVHSLDISDIKQAEAELRAAQVELIKQERLATLGQLAATVSHELRNPLGTIGTSLAVVEAKVDGRGLELEPALGRMKRSVERCDRIISEMLDYARDHDPFSVPTNIDAWLGDLLDEQDLPDGIALRLDLKCSDADVEIDPDLLRRAVVNLLENARDAMLGREGGTQAPPDNSLVVETRRNGDRAEITIADNGPGMAPEVLVSAFEPLFSTKAFGVGLGLPVVKKIVEQHEGTIVIDSAPGAGTRVTLSLPLSKVGAETRRAG